MFKVSKKADPATFWATVTGYAPSTKPGGARVKFDFDVEFRLIDTKQDENTPTDWDWFQEHVIGWRRVEDDDGQALEFCEENLRAAYAMEWARLPIIQAYYAEVSGTAQRKKN